MSDYSTLTDQELNREAERIRWELERRKNGGQRGGDAPYPGYGDDDSGGGGGGNGGPAGGPIIERERIALLPGVGLPDWSAVKAPNFKASADTPLIAAMRCFVASKFGEEVENSTCK